LQVFGLRHLDELPQIELIQGVHQPSHSRSRLGSESTTDGGASGINAVFPEDVAADLTKTTNPYPVAEEEKNVKTFTTTKARPEFVAEEPTAALMEPKRRPSAAPPAPFSQVEDEDDFEEDDEEIDDLDEDDDEEEDEDDEELEDEWEEVEDEDDDEEEDEDEDEDWDDEDWDDDDWDDDDEEEDEDEEEEGDA
jgi:hypothetical protein